MTNREIESAIVSTLAPGARREEDNNGALVFVNEMAASLNHAWWRVYQRFCALQRETPAQHPALVRWDRGYYTVVGLPPSEPASCSACDPAEWDHHNYPGEAH